MDNLVEMAATTTAQQDQLAEAIDRAINAITDAFRKIADAITEAWERIKEAFSPLIRRTIDALYRAAAERPRDFYLYKHSKKKRVREKYRKRISRRLATMIRTASEE